MDTLSAFIVITIAALVHASFQLSVSMLTLLSGHTIGKKQSVARLRLLTGSFVAGVGTITALLVSLTALVLTPFAQKSTIAMLIWTIVCGSLMGVGIAVWLFYYRHQAGTSLWIPRGFARYLSSRAKATEHSAEAFGLGMSSVVSELIFVFAPITVTALVLIQLTPIFQLVGVVCYTSMSIISLLSINALVSNGVSLGRIQRWREKNKMFLQFAAGSVLLVLGFFIYVNQVMGPTVLAAAGGV